MSFELTIGSQAVRVIDLTLPVTLGAEVFPGDPTIERSVFTSIDETGYEHYVHHFGDHAFTPHADAPNHYGRGAAGIDALPLEPYLGRCRVLDVVVEPGQRIPPRAVPHPVSAPRVLLKTGTYPGPENFNEDFAALSVELVERLHEEGWPPDTTAHPSCRLSSSTVPTAPAPEVCLALTRMV